MLNRLRNNVLGVFTALTLVALAVLAHWALVPRAPSPSSAGTR